MPARRDRTLGRNPRVGRRGAVRDEGRGWDPRFVRLRPLRRHRSRGPIGRLSLRGTARSSRHDIVRSPTELATDRVRDAVGIARTSRRPWCSSRGRLLVGACAGGDDGVEPVAIELLWTSSLYEGEGEPDVVVVSDMPRRGEAAAATKEIVDAMEFVLRSASSGRASCASASSRATTPSGGSSTPASAGAMRVRSSPRSRWSASSGRSTPGCAELQIPIVSRTAAGPLAMISPVQHGRRADPRPDALSRSIPTAFAATCAS